MANKQQPYQFALVGSPGKGKTMSFRNMNPSTTGFINAENKPLPFINNFTNYSAPNSWQECYQKLIEYAKDDSINVVVLDSLSAYLDSVLKTARDTKRGFDIWNFFNEEIGKLMYVIKNYPKYLIVTAHSEWVETENGAEEKRIMVPGGQWKGKIEKDFTIVVYTDLLMSDEKRNYVLQLNSNGKTSAKTPPMFLSDPEDLGVEQIPNDFQLFIDRVDKVLNN
jgi:hypothetical protein